MGRASLRQLAVFSSTLRHLILPNLSWLVSLGLPAAVSRLPALQVGPPSGLFTWAFERTAAAPAMHTHTYSVIGNTSAAERVWHYETSSLGDGIKPCKHAAIALVPRSTDCKPMLRGYNVSPLLPWWAHRSSDNQCTLIEPIPRLFDDRINDYADTRGPPPPPLLLPHCCRHQ